MNNFVAVSKEIMFFLIRGFLYCIFLFLVAFPGRGESDGEGVVVVLESVGQ